MDFLLGYNFMYNIISLLLLYYPPLHNIFFWLFSNATAFYCSLLANLLPYSIVVCYIHHCCLMFTFFFFLFSYYYIGHYYIYFYYILLLLLLLTSPPPASSSRYAFVVDAKYCMYSTILPRTPNPLLGPNGG